MKYTVKKIPQCVIDDNKICSNCGECIFCDLDMTKICDNCCKCIGMGDKDYETILIDEIIEE
ncbi:MAG: hypothetical protein GXW85_12025 [Clostridia bacterium]|nr:hypothetical protein [Clostridia bacterium]